jgi:hypothetical protein
MGVPKNQEEEPPHNKVVFHCGGMATLNSPSETDKPEGPCAQGFAFSLRIGGFARGKTRSEKNHQ